MKLNNLLSRLQKVKRNANDAWIACCPAHDDRSPSLAIKDAGDGRIVLKCFAGCETIDILGAVGLDWEDVMPEKAVVHHAPQVKQTLYATDALKVLRTESQIITMAAMDISKGRAIGESELKRIRLAMERINTINEATHG